MMKTRSWFSVCPRDCWMSTIKAALLAICLWWQPASAQQSKVNGVNLAGGRKVPTMEVFHELDSIGCNTIALNPYSYGSKYVPKIEFDLAWQWDGEKTEGITKQVEFARSKGMGIIMKPHVWIAESGWAGDLELANEQEWKMWHEEYRNYILHYARMSEALDVEVLCIGTELKTSLKADPKFWSSLIADVRAMYSGQVTYASNWDNYSNVPFWKELDFISIDAYFPCDTGKQVDLNTLSTCLEAEKETLLDFAKSMGQKVLFTEFGYRSIDYACGPQWELTSDDYEDINQLNQVLGYRAFLKTFWPEPVVLGGCLWKWYPKARMDGDNNDYSPQGKYSLQVIQAWYKKFAGFPLGKGHD